MEEIHQKSSFKENLFRCEYKLRWLASSEGHLYQFDVYTTQCMLILNGFGSQDVAKFPEFVENPTNHAVYLGKIL